MFLSASFRFKDISVSRGCDGVVSSTAYLAIENDNLTQHVWFQVTAKEQSRRNCLL